MALSTRNVDESKRIRKMSFSYIKDTLARRSSRQSGTRSHVCCSETLVDANGDFDDTVNKCSKTELPVQDDGGKCSCISRAVSEKHKLGLFKTLKMRFQLKASIGARPIKCKSKPTIKVLDSSSSSYSHSVSDESSSEGFASNNPRKSKQSRGRMSVCSMPPPVRFVRSVDNNGQNKPSNSSSFRCGERVIPSGRRASDGEVSRKLKYLPQDKVERVLDSLDSSALDRSACISNVDHESNLPHSRLSTIVKTCDNDSIHNFLLNLDREGVVQYESCEVVRHSSGDNDLPLPSPTSRSLTYELFKLAKYGWYWGPISREEAEEKLLDLPDGTFLVRDSSADRYLLSVSFRSSGKTFHTRIEHSHGLFSFYSNPGHDGFASIIELINHSMSYSESAVFCYSRPRAPGHPAFPVRLAKPVSRFTQVRSLQYLCRFVIRQYTRVDNIQKLPLPTRLKGYIQEGHY